jgi:phage shock protein PspC (stress-responsive transcriptional regulator)
MKKTIRIHISGYIFNIEEDAYTALEDWLKKISTQYSNEEGGDEIVNDIEMRVAELFEEEVGTDSGVISTNTVNKIINIMGMPEEIEEELTEEKTTQTQKKGQQKKTSTGNKSWKSKRLYRDEENSALGGVCSGLGNYFDIDPIIIRIIFVITIFFGGFGPIVYILLWIIVPKAETTAQKLEMKGDPVNIANIEKAIKDEFETVKNKVIEKTKSENFQNIKKKFSDAGDRTADVISKAFRGLYGLIGLAFIVAGILAILALFSFIFNNALPNFLSFGSNIFDWKPFLGLLPIHVSTSYVSVLLFILLVIPFLMLVLFGTKALFGYRSKGKFIGYSGLTIWIVGIVLASLVAIQVFENYSAESNHVRHEKINEQNTQVLYLSLNNKYDSDFNNPEYTVSNYNIAKTKKSMKLFGKPLLNIKKSPNKESNIKLSYTANGKTKKDAFKRAKKIQYLWQERDSFLYFNPYFTFNENHKLYKRELLLTIELPVGKTVYIDSNMIDLIYDIENTQNIWDEDMIGKKWIMTEDGLSLLDSEVKNIEKEEKEIELKKDSLNLNKDTTVVSNEVSI